METPKVGDLVEIGDVIGEVIWVGEEFCLINYPTEDNEDGSPSFADKEFGFEDIEAIIDHPADIKYFKARFRKEKLISSLWPMYREEGDGMDEIDKIRSKAHEPSTSWEECLALLDRAIELLTTMMVKNTEGRE